MVIKISDETQFKNYLLDVENNLYDINGEYCLDRNIDWNLIEYKFIMHQAVTLELTYLVEMTKLLNRYLLLKLQAIFLH